ncbi:glycosyltransferase family 2 protein [Microbacterium sp. 18062]|uniref:glycosyltransferase family 2 protein n=1 Tax=Microbacterium sp. 18062 TaxID=2681410 RepID=UPI00135AEC0B|nr:glycosyltransferase family 2 protein [Microbacterium sp. 18062]
MTPDLGTASAAVPLDYAIVVATRNRLDMLKVSLPLLLAQSRPAGRIVVVDHSDDHAAVRKHCLSLATTSMIPLEVHHGRQANLPSQRNQGLTRVREAVVAFPDDDSLWFPDTAAQLMAVYEADRNGCYGAVSATEVHVPPREAAPERPPREGHAKDHPAIMRIRNRVEATIVPQPFNLFGAERIDALGSVAATDGLSYPLVETIGGYLMSFRTEVASGIAFDELLGSRIGYATHEDKDLGLRVLAAGKLIAAAPDAHVFHNAAPGRRADGFDYGFFHILNYMYACYKTVAASPRARRAIPRYLRYKVFLYSLRRADPHGRDIHRGAQAALTALPEMASASPGSLAERYTAICDRNGIGAARKTGGKIR